MLKVDEPSMTMIMLLIVVILWGLSFVAAKIVLDYLSPVELVAIRVLTGMLTLRAVMAFRNIKVGFDRRDYIILAAASVILGVHFMIQATGLTMTSATNTGWLIATIPIFIAAASYLFLRERLTSIKWLGIGVAAAGVIVLVSNGRPGNLGWLDSAGDWLILGSCLTWTAYTILTRDITRRKNPLAVIAAILTPAAVILSLYVTVTSPLSKFTNLPGDIYLLLIFLGVFCVGLAHWLWLEGLSRKGAASTGVFLYIEPIVTTLAAIPILGEEFSLYSAIGAMLIISGVYLVERRANARQ